MPAGAQAVLIMLLPPPRWALVAALPVSVEATIAALPHDAHPMGTILTGLCALSTLHPEQVGWDTKCWEALLFSLPVALPPGAAGEGPNPSRSGRSGHRSPFHRQLPPTRPQNPALAGQNIYQSKEVQDKQIVRLIGKIPTLAALAYHRASGRKPAQPNQNLGYTEVRDRGGVAAGGESWGWEHDRWASVATIASGLADAHFHRPTHGCHPTKPLRPHCPTCLCRTSCTCWMRGATPATVPTRAWPAPLTFSSSCTPSTS